MSSFTWWVFGGFVVAVNIVLWRLWPMLRGRTKRGEPTVNRVFKWNQYVAPLFQKVLGQNDSSEDALIVAKAISFESRLDNQVRTVCTWSMVPTVLPDTDFVILAQPGEPLPDADPLDRPPSLMLGAIAAEDLRELLMGYLREQLMWGHRMFISVWPEDVDLDAVVERLTPMDEFKARNFKPAPIEEETS